MDRIGDKKRIAKNSLLLYIRMAVVMAVSIYTSRVILNVLGVTDYGIFSVVGGVVAMLGFLDGALRSATSRYITFALGKGEKDQLNLIFCTAVNVHALLSVFVVVVAETLGLWYFYEYLNIPGDRTNAAFWVYQFSIATTVIAIMAVPYNATIVAHEKMSVFAYISIVEVVLKLLILYLLLVISADKLIMYAVLLVLIQLLIRCCYTIYCKRHFQETNYRFVWNARLVKEMFSFAVFSLWGNLAVVTYTQGINLLLNAFFGPVANAARAVAVQVQSAVQQFVHNFQMAMNPQITKSYAQNDKSYSFDLVFRSARFSYLLMLCAVMPIFFEVDTILKVWLKIVPDNSAIFIRITLCTSLIYTLSNPLIVLAHATGKIKKYQLIVGGILLLILPFSYLCLRFGLPIWTPFAVHFCIEFIDSFVRLYLLRGLAGVSARQYVRDVWVKVLKVTICAVILPTVLSVVLPHSTGIECLMIVVCVLSSSFFAYTVGLTKSERLFFRHKACDICHKLKCRV